MADHASLFKTYSITAFWTDFSKEAVSIPFFLIRTVVQIPLFKDPANGIWYRQNQAAILEDRMFSTDTFELFDDFFYPYAGP